MPGLNQLKSFRDNLKDLGDETKIRIQRGERPVDIPLPEGISEEDDSEDFVLGIPEQKDNTDNTDSQEGAEAELPVDLPETDDGAVAGGEVPDLDSILNPQSGASDVPDLSEFLDNPVEAAPEPQQEETPLEDLDLESLLKPSEPEEPEQSSDTDAAAQIADGFSESSPSDIPDLSELGDLADIGESLESPGQEEPAAAEEPAPVAEESADDDFAFNGEVIDMNEGLPEEIAETDAGSEPFEQTPAEDFAAEESDAESAAASAVEENAFDAETVSADDIGAAAEPAGDFDSGAGESGSMDIDFSTDDVFDAPAGDGLPADNPLSDFGGSSDIGGFDFGDTGDGPVDASMDVPPEVFDAPELSDDIDFGGSSGDGGEEFPVTGSKEVDDFVLDDNFEIPGFSDTDFASIDKKKQVKIDTADFSNAVLKPKNTLTDKEYATFRKNLNEYPLNVRIAVEDLIVKNEFTDDAVFEVVEKVLKRVSARQLASHLEKMLDIAINVPRDFERRSFAQYEAYKASFQYQLYNRIIPGIIAAILIFMTGACLFDAFVSYVYKPIKAGNLYAEGYTLLEQNDYEQAEIKFRQATEYRLSQEWFFRYARGYRQHKQYERAAWMYENILLQKKFNNGDRPNKQAGIEYAQMRAYDESKYEEAERLVKRKILDHYVNDVDATLLLGDINLEWAEVDEEKFDVARRYYTELCQRFPASDLYWARMLRYYMRTDKLVKVLELKPRFYPREDSLTGPEWTDLSGYLLEKLYGKLTPMEEEYREKIEDILGMLKYSIANDGKNPIARYNMACYNMYNGNNEGAKTELKRSLELFKNLEKRTRSNTYKEIDASRLLGELYVKSKEYLKAEETYTHGIDVFKNENKKSGLEGDFNTGRLFADMGDLDYFISGDMEGALYNYETAIATHNDVPALNYRVGVIKYNNSDYDGALLSFLKTVGMNSEDPNVRLALGNVLSLRGDNYGAQTHYARMLDQLNNIKAEKKAFSPKLNEEDYETVDKFLKVNNNLGVTYYKLALQTGDSKKNGLAITRLQDSLRAWDALTRNDKTMMRLEGSNLAQQNLKYMTQSYRTFEPAIYTDIPKVMMGDKELK